MKTLGLFLLGVIAFSVAAIARELARPEELVRAIGFLANDDLPL